MRRLHNKKKDFIILNKKKLTIKTKLLSQRTILYRETL
jgi:hypothetical protein